MTQHSSLKGTSVGTRHRNVLKRHERIRKLQETERWSDRRSIYKLPKLKLIKLKVKKAKSGKEGETQVEGAAAPQGQAPGEAPKKLATEKTKEKEKG